MAEFVIPYLIPAVKAEAERLGIDLGTIRGSGVGGRVTLDDVRRQATPMAVAGSTGSQPRRREMAPVILFAGGPTVEVDLYSLNPGRDYVASVGNGAPTTPAPTMFAVGDLPPFTSSGVDVEVLRQVQWRYRHSAAFSSDRALVLRCIEEPGGDDCVTVEGERAWRKYVSDTWRWATTPPEVVQGFSEDDYNEFFGSPHG